MSLEADTATERVNILLDEVELSKDQETRDAIADEDEHQGGKIARLGECTGCQRKFERLWLHSHDQGYDPENEEVAITPRPT